MLYNCKTAHPNGIVMRPAPNPWGPWSLPQTIFNPTRDHGYCEFIAHPTCPKGMFKGNDGADYGPYSFAGLTIGTKGTTLARELDLLLHTGHLRPLRPGNHEKHDRRAARAGQAPAAAALRHALRLKQGENQASGRTRDAKPGFTRSPATIRGAGAPAPDPRSEVTIAGRASRPNIVRHAASVVPLPALLWNSVAASA
jgi:hypothetical protein